MRNLFRLPFVLCCAMLAVAGACEKPMPTDPGIPPAQMRVCERKISMVCGTWTLNGDKYSATWEDGSTADITIVRFQPGSGEFRRVDFGKNAGLTATYIGAVEGRTLVGQVYWSIQGTSEVGRWTAEW
jgi:hypothetical protein